MGGRKSKKKTSSSRPQKLLNPAASPGHRPVTRSVARDDTESVATTRTARSTRGTGNSPTKTINSDRASSVGASAMSTLSISEYEPGSRASRRIHGVEPPYLGLEGTVAQVNRQYSNRYGGRNPTGVDNREVVTIFRNEKFDAIHARRHATLLLDKQNKGEVIGAFALKYMYFGQEWKYVGHVIEAAEHYQQVDTRLRYPDPSVRIFDSGSNTPGARDGVPVMRKLRPMVVLWKTPAGHFCIPMYTHDGKGLAHLEDHLKTNKMAILSAHSASTVAPDKHGGPIEWVPIANAKAAELSYSNLDRPVLVDNYDWSRVLGFVDGKSYNKLVVALLWNMYQNSLQGYKFWGEDDAGDSGLRQPNSNTALDKNMRLKRFEVAKDDARKRRNLDDNASVASKRRKA